MTDIPQAAIDTARDFAIHLDTTSGVAYVYIRGKWEIDKVLSSPVALERLEKSMTDATIPQAAIEAFRSKLGWAALGDADIDDGLQAAAPFMQYNPKPYDIHGRIAYAEGKADGIEAAAEVLRKQIANGYINASLRELLNQICALADRKPEVLRK